MDKTAYEPGESGEIKAYYHTGNYNGKVQKTIQVFSNTQGGDIIRIKFLATIVTDLKPATSSLYFPDVIPGKTQVKKVFIENNMGKPLEIKGFHVKANASVEQKFPVKVKLLKEANNKEFLQFSLSSDKNLKFIDRASYTISVETNSKKLSHIDFFVIIRMQRPVLVQPISVFMYGTPQGKSHVRRIQLKCNTGKPFKVEKVDYKGKFLSFDIVQEAPDMVHVWISTKPDAPAGIFNNVFTIVANENGNEKTFAIPVRGSITK